ncbi:MAG: imidazoleglycerol-phosphate dehydratase HisB [Candidatus Izemoplasma sp.]|nr:imidazoleglycerol-phosphate dehydratase HisB [Candidatus Izemoplasma sp.]
MRQSSLNRQTKETDINATLKLDGSGKTKINTGIGFFDHMLTAFAFYAKIDLTIMVKGDLAVDDHHTVEDVGIVIGQLINKSLGDKNGIARFASTLTPMDDALADIALDISNRPYLTFNATFTREKIGQLSLENVQEFFYALMIESRMTCHINLRYFENNHHAVEAIFKGFGRALNMAKSITGNTVSSTKGVL